MGLIDCSEVDIDVDISPLLGTRDSASLIDSRWYELCLPRAERPAELQHKLEQGLRNSLLSAQWEALRRRRVERRGAMRAPILTRVHIDGGKALTALNISLSGLRCAGEPRLGRFEIEFSLPGGPFPICATAEVSNLTRTGLATMVGLHFVAIEGTYVDLVAAYIERRRRREQRVAGHPA